jgi:ribonuclease III
MTFEELQTIIHVQFHDINLLKQAFFHRSYLNESKDVKNSNERLEFLGDAVLSFCTSRYLYDTYPQFPEGTLTNIRSSLVKTTSLAQTARELHLGDLLFLSHGEEESGGRNNQSLLADCFEALLGAIYLDQGVDVVITYLTTFLFPKTDQIVEQKAYVDFKSLLQEIIQEESRISPTYRVIKSEGPDHAKTFYIEAVAENTVLGTGSGKSKQEAEQQAALAALEKMGKL